MRPELVAAAMVLACLACGGPPAQDASALRPVDERRAADVIAKVFNDARLDPERGRVVELGPLHPVTMEISARGRSFGVAYLTREEEVALAVNIPPHRANEDALVIVPGSNRSHVLVLFERDYMQDDSKGESHSQTSIAAELKIERDVRDFLRKVEHDNWP